MTPDFAVIIASLSLIVTILGWSKTYSKQKQLESIKGDIQKIVSEHDTRFDYLHKRRGEVIDELYKRMDRIMQLLQASVRAVRFNDEKLPEEQRNEGLGLISPLTDYYYQNRLYIDRDLCEQIEKLLQNLYEISGNIGTASSLVPFRLGFDPSIANMHKEFIDKATNIMTNDLPPIHNLIEEKMRAILGIGSEAKSSH